MVLPATPTPKKRLDKASRTAASVPGFGAASPGAAASNGTASRAAYIKAKTDRHDVMALAPVPVGPE